MDVQLDTRDVGHVPLCRCWPLSLVGGGLPTRDRLPVGKGGAGHMRKSRFPLRIVARTGWPGSEAATEDHKMVGSTLTGRSQETWLYSGEPVVQ